MQDEMKAKAIEMLSSGAVRRVVGWREGDFDYDVTPAFFESVEDLKAHFVYNDFCGPNLSKYMVKVSRMEGKSLVFLKPCDTYSFNQLLDEHRIRRDQVHIVGVPCNGMIDCYKALRKSGGDVLAMSSDGTTVKVKTLTGEMDYSKNDVIEERCLCCKGGKHMVYDELIGEEGRLNPDSNRFRGVKMVEKKSPEERFAFWRGELSRCIRCNACRDVCPACTCELCVFNNEASGATTKAPVNSFEENMYHIIRAFHVAGRCTDCGECSRVCPERIPLHLINRKFIKDYDELYGDYQAGESSEGVSPLFTYKESDPDPSVVLKKGGSDNA